MSVISSIDDLARCHCMGVVHESWERCPWCGDPVESQYFEVTAP